ncbi:hypothetical protein ACEQPO_02090 [Bacillus sp. SL00103]
MKRRLITIFAGVLSMILLLSACGGNGQDQGKQQRDCDCWRIRRRLGKEYQTDS